MTHLIETIIIATLSILVAIGLSYDTFTYFIQISLFLGSLWVFLKTLLPIVYFEINKYTQENIIISFALFITCILLFIDLMVIISQIVLIIFTFWILIELFFPVPICYNLFKKNEN